MRPAALSRKKISIAKNAQLLSGDSKQMMNWKKQLIMKL
jgi:hypothetical protein